MSASRPSTTLRPITPQPRQTARHSGRGGLVLRLLLPLLLLAALLGSAGSALASPSRQADPPTLVADAAIVVEYPSGKILFEKNAHEQRAMASTTKIMTALLSLQRANLTDRVIVPPESIVGEASMGLVAGEDISVEDLLYGLLLPSGNDAAMTLAYHVGQSLPPIADDDTPVERFVNLMNNQAVAMGLTDTHFANPHGLDAKGHYTSATDLVSIAWYALHDPEFNKIISTIDIDVENHSLENINRLLTRYEGADGVKTGQTDNAGLCLVSSATRNGRRMVAVVLNSYRWYDDSAALLDYGFASDPNAPADTLNIAKRANLLWLLASGLPTPLPTARPTQPPATPVAAGGSVQLADNQQPPTDSQPVLAPATPGPDTSASINSLPVPPQAAQDGGFGWFIPLLALLLSGAVMVLYWRRYSHQRATGANESWDEKKQKLVEANGVAAPRPNGKSATPRPLVEPRRISLIDDGGAEAHAKRGIALAYRGQEGSSLSEFMMAVERNPEFEFGTLEGFYDMPPAGYLSLARAYAAHDRPHYARALLQLGAETHPDDKIIRKMLAELTPAPSMELEEPVTSQS